MRYRFALCDDDKMLLPALKIQLLYAVERAGLQADVSLFSSAAALLEAMRGGAFDALFLDIDMPDMDGIALGETLRERGDAVCMFFLSAREDRVFETFRLSPLRFIRKNRLREDLQEAAQALSRQLARVNREKLAMNTAEGVVSVPIGEIMWAESLGKQQSLMLTGGPIEVRHTFKELCDRLSPHGFLQVHRCYIVNCRFIFSIEAGKLIMDNRWEIPISRYRQAACREAFRRSLSDGFDAE